MDRVQTRALDLKVGDRVLFGKYSGTEVKVDNQAVIVMREDDVMAIVD
jgi:chaperonin GroES